MIQIYLSESTLEVLRRERLYHPHPRVRRKLEVLYLKGLKIAHQEICQRVGITKPTLVKYLREYQEQGLEKYKEVKFRQPTSALAPYAERIEAAFRERPPRSLGEASQRIEAVTGVWRSPAQVGKFLKRLGMKRRKMGAVPGQAVTEAKVQEQERFREQALEPRLAEAQAGQRAVFF
jgi:transposase